MSGSNLEALAAELVAATATLESSRIEAACERLIDGLRSSRTPLSEMPSRQTLEHLRAIRRFEPMQRLADTLIRCGSDTAAVRRQYAQALIDRGQLVPAVTLLEGLVRRTRDEPEEHAEALGLLGRVYKQIYLESSGGRPDRRALDRALEAYRRGFEIAPARHVWHGINLVALALRAGRDGLQGRSDDEAALALARQLLAMVGEKPQPGAWDCATAAEAAVALGDWDTATSWMRRYAEDPASELFALEGSLRQLTQVWGLVSGSSPAGQVVGVLQAAVLQRRGSAELPPGELQRLGQVEASAFERILGDTGAVTYTWVRRALQRAEAVAMVRQPDGRGVGTGFLIRGGDLHAALGDEPLLLTNEHVVSGDPTSRGLPPDAATITFEVRDAAGGGSRREHQVVAILASSPSTALDFSLLRLDPRPEAPVCPIARRLPAIGASETQRVYVIGHPEGRELSFSLQDNRLLDHEGPPQGRPSLEGRVLLHYRAPTEPGSSGSPVFEQSGWNVVGLHHAGGELMRCLNGGAGTYAANEGIWIQSVAMAVAAQLA